MSDKKNEEERVEIEGMIVTQESVVVYAADRVVKYEE